MSFEERLGLASFSTQFDNKFNNHKEEKSELKKKNNKEKNFTTTKIEKKKKIEKKNLKRAYYKQSLIWHPDRWAAMPLYIIAVQGAFELINEAYNSLLLSTKKNENFIVSKNNKNSEENNVNVYF
jgi:hypothetical protein